MEKENKADDFFKKRAYSRRNIMLKVLKSLEKENNKGISTVELYHHVFKKGYSYSLKTLENDLRLLESKNKIVKDVQYQGRGYGTRSFWKIKEAGENE